MKGSSLEALVRHSVERQKGQGLHLIQTSPRFVGRVGAEGAAQGRLVGAGALDFIGDLHGRHVTFDAKSTTNKTSFRLDLLKRHQVTIVRRAHERGAVAFFLVEFSQLPGGPRYFALTWPTLQPFWSRLDAGGPASIPFAQVEAGCLEIRRTRSTLDLVAAVEALAASQRRATPS